MACPVDGVRCPQDNDPDRWPPLTDRREQGASGVELGEAWVQQDDVRAAGGDELERLIRGTGAGNDHAPSPDFQQARETLPNQLVGIDDQHGEWRAFGRGLDHESNFGAGPCPQPPTSIDTWVCRMTVRPTSFRRGG
jgi:hypothetical protein